MLAVDEVRYVIHRTGTVKGIHGDKILEGRRLQFAKVFLHTRGLELERADRPSVTIKLVCGRIFNVNLVDVNVDTQTIMDDTDGFVDDTEGFQPEEVHLDQPCFFNDRTFVLCAKQLFTSLLILGSRNGHPVAHIVAADDDPAGVYTRVTDITLKHLSIANGVTHHFIG